jgi:hypothetical protein
VVDVLSSLYADAVARDYQSNYAQRFEQYDGELQDALVQRLAMHAPYNPPFV